MNPIMMKVELSPYADRADTKCIYLNSKDAEGLMKVTNETEIDMVRRKYTISITGYPCMDTYGEDTKDIKLIVNDKLDTSQISSDLMKTINSPFDDYIIVLNRKPLRSRG